MKVIVTGGAGFIGSHLVRHLLGLGHAVMVLDHFSDGKNIYLDLVGRWPKLTWHTADIGSDSLNLSQYLRGVDWVFHLAGRSGTAVSMRDPGRYHRANVDSTVALLETARRARVKRFIYASSASCYAFTRRPVQETGGVRMTSPYSLTKYAGELYVLHWAKVYKLPAVSLRLFQVYGVPINRNGDYGPVITTFIRQKAAGRPITVRGNGRQRRDFIYVKDVIEAMVSAASSTISGESFNVGSGQGHSINEFVKRLGGRIRYVPSVRSEPMVLVADVSKITNMLGWTPKVSFEEGITRVLHSLYLPV